MTAPPLPTFVPQDAWYTITTGNVNPSVADTVPDITYLQPDGDQDGLEGPLDGAIIGLAGEVSTMDGGQKWLMWDADSLLADNGSTVFCPFTEPGNPGRWISLGAATSGPGVVQNVQSFEAGATHTITASTAVFIQVFVQGRAAAAVTTLNLPGSTFLGQTISVKDAEGDAGTWTISIVGTIDGLASYDLVANYQGQNFVWNGTEWSAT